MDNGHKALMTVINRQLQLPDYGSGVRGFGAKSRRDFVGSDAGPLDSLARKNFKFVEVLSLMPVVN